jgi:hypothetical protein
VLQHMVDISSSIELTAQQQEQDGCNGSDKAKTPLDAAIRLSAQAAIQPEALRGKQVESTRFVNSGAISVSPLMCDNSFLNESHS